MIYINDNYFTNFTSVICEMYKENLQRERASIVWDRSPFFYLEISRKFS